MEFKPGKYDELATLVRGLAKAQGVVILIGGGDKGDGFSVQATPAMCVTLPTVLRLLADQIEEGIVKSARGG